MNGDVSAHDNDNLRSRLIAILVSIIVASVMALSAVSIAAFDSAIEPEMGNRSRLIGSIIRSEIQHALELGIPFDAIAGLDRYLSETLAKFDEVYRIDVNSVTGRTIASVERSAAPAVSVASVLPVPQVLWVTFSTDSGSTSSSLVPGLHDIHIYIYK